MNEEDKVDVLSFKRRSGVYWTFTIRCSNLWTIIRGNGFVSDPTKKVILGKNLVLGWRLNFECKKIAKEQTICSSRIVGKEETH